MPYILSIVVPTKDRYFYLKHLIVLIKSFESDMIELIIQDNTDDNTEIVDYIKTLNYPHLKYFHTEKHISVSLNSDKAILNSTGEYVCFIGDDDGVLSNIVNCVKWMKQNNIEALLSSPLTYNWPDYYESIKNEHNIGRLFYGNFSSIIMENNCINVLKEKAKHGFQDLSNIPKVYQGIVKRSCLEKIFKIGGTYFPGPSPDMANAIALCFVIKKFIVVNLPIIISGQCKYVGGGGRLNNNLKKIKDVPFLPQNIEEVWCNRLPPYWCGVTIWAESAIEALNYIKRLNDHNIKINYESVYIKYVKRNKNHIISALREVFRLSDSKIKLSLKIVSYVLTSSFSNLKRKFQYSNNNSINCKLEISSIEEVNNFMINKFSPYMQSDIFSTINKKVEN